MPRSPVLTCIVGSLLAASTTSAQLYSQDFEIDSTAGWTHHSGPSDSAANFFFDYSTVGIPVAPNAVNSRSIVVPQAPCCQ